jgi:hypothetical protein
LFRVSVLAIAATSLVEHAVRPIAVIPPTDCANVLPSADFGDAFAIDVRNATLDAPEATRRAFAGQPGWIARLLAMRNILVSPFGLKTGADRSLPASRRVGVFPVVSSSSERVVLGFGTHTLHGVHRHREFQHLLHQRPDDLPQCSA